MNNIVQRTITGILFLIIIVSSILFCKYFFYIVFLSVSLLGFYEFYKLLKSHNISINLIGGAIIGTSIFTIIWLDSFKFIKQFNPYMILPIIFILFITELYRKKTNPFENIGYTLFGILYIILPISLLSEFYNLSMGSYQLLLGYLILIWSFDTFAYLVGIKFGKNRLFERVSPKKSWEGFIGGAIMTIFIAYILSYFLTNHSFAVWIPISLIVVVFGTYGDLVESLLKRSFNTKDSSNLLPGHGGVLDRFDSVFLSSPFVYAYVMLIK